MKQNLELMSGNLTGKSWICWPPSELTTGEPFHDEPKALAIINDNFNRYPTFIPEHKKCSGERVLVQVLFAQGNEGVNAFAEIDWLNRKQDCMLRRDLQHLKDSTTALHVSFQKQKSLLIRKIDTKENVLRIFKFD